MIFNINPIEVKRICASIVMLVVWITFLNVASSIVVTIAVYGLAGWYIGGLITTVAKALFPHEDDE